MQPWRGITEPQAYGYLQSSCKWTLIVLQEQELSLRYQVVGTVPRRNKDWSLSSRTERFSCSPRLTPGSAIIEAAEWVQGYLEADPPASLEEDRSAESANV